MTGGWLTPEEVTRFVAERVAPYKKIRAVEIIDEIPKAPTGKILRRVLVERERTAAMAGQARRSKESRLDRDSAHSGRPQN